MPTTKARVAKPPHPDLKVGGVARDKQSGALVVLYAEMRPSKTAPAVAFRLSAPDVWPPVWRSVENLAPADDVPLGRGRQQDDLRAQPLDLGDVAIALVTPPWAFATAAVAFALICLAIGWSA